VLQNAGAKRWSQNVTTAKWLKVDESVSSLCVAKIRWLWCFVRYEADLCEENYIKALIIGYCKFYVSSSHLPIRLQLHSLRHTWNKHSGITFRVRTHLPRNSKCLVFAFLPWHHRSFHRHPSSSFSPSINSYDQQLRCQMIFEVSSGSSCNDLKYRSVCWPQL